MKDWLRTFGHPDATATTGFAISSSTESLVVSILSLGTFFGALAAAPVGDWIGRKWGIIFANLIFCFGVALQTAATEIPLFVVGRVFAGLGVGCTLTARRPRRTLSCCLHSRIKIIFSCAS